LMDDIIFSHNGAYIRVYQDMHTSVRLTGVSRLVINFQCISLQGGPLTSLFLSTMAADCALGAKSALYNCPVIFLPTI